tara:strand:+ start:132 stop:1574 length:1443 start_codon:yes stop_codon:yes gene_type:complete
MSEEIKEIKIEHLSRKRLYKSGTRIFEKGDLRSDAYIIVEGKVEIITLRDGKEVVGATLGAGEIFGEMALLEGGTRTAAARAAEDTEVFAISRQVLRERMTGIDPIVGMLMSLLIDRYRKARMYVPESVEIPNADVILDRLKEATGDQKENLSQEDYLEKGLVPEILEDLAFQRRIAFKELEMEQRLREAIDRDEFSPRLQPIVSLEDGCVRGFETLIRWEDPVEGLISPASFIPVAERVNMVHHLDQSMLRQACRLVPELKKMAEGRLDDLFVSVNLSGINFEDGNLVEVIDNIIKDSGTDPRHIKLEITESALIADPANAQEILDGLKNLGVAIALDDFGTGYSSLGYLHKFPIDSIKIDRSFVSQIQHENKSVDIINAIIGLADSFKMNVIAEGIEDMHDWNVLNNIGCEMGQGYLFGRPLEVCQLNDFIRKNLRLDENCLSPLEAAKKSKEEAEKARAEGTAPEEKEEPCGSSIFA